MRESHTNKSGSLYKQLSPSITLSEKITTTYKCDT